MYIVKKVIDYDQPDQKIYSQTLRVFFFINLNENKAPNLSILVCIIHCWTPGIYCVYVGTNLDKYWLNILTPT